jgi:glycosyltransferase involved in cell wall biosynthesis
MRIGVMLRHLGEPGGIGVYTRNLLHALLKIDHHNSYHMLYRRSACLGSFSASPNVTEIVLRGPNKLWWDQISVPVYARKANLDVIFNPKLSAPLFTRRATILVMHGAEQFAVPSAFKWHDRIYFTVANRFYCRFVSAIIAMTQIGARDIARLMGAPPRRIHVIPEAFNELCRIMPPEETLAVRHKYSLPKHFVLFLGGMNPIKNFGNVLRAFSRLTSEYPHKLVVVGFRRWKISKDLALVDRLGLRSRVVFTGFVPDEEIPAFYNVADVLVFPSLYEGFGIPVLEAMACGCPVVTTETGCSPEVAGGAAMLVNPYDPEQISEAIKRVLTEPDLRQQLIERGVQRAKDFSWNKCARETLALIESLHGAKDSSATGA